MRLQKLLVAAAAALAAAACSDSEYEYHFINILSPEQAVYADQSADSLVIVCSDSWEASTEAEWISPKTFSHELTPDNQIRQASPLVITPNTTGKMKSGYFTIRSDGREQRRTCLQAGWVNIISPDPVYREGDNVIGNPFEARDPNNVTAAFEIMKGADAAAGEIVLRLFDAEASVTTQDSWISLADTALTRAGGSAALPDTLAFAIKANDTGAERAGTILISTRNGVRTPVVVRQGKRAE